MNGSSVTSTGSVSTSSILRVCNEGGSEKTFLSTHRERRCMEETSSSWKDTEKCGKQVICSINRSSDGYYRILEFSSWLIRL